ncbi:hypothetical protein JIN85_19265 [Luteolibacter pohnpeiensis]|uniref:Uncharacterized protein n=1 Tax=Luteolibacter pohnpeiensis TaxID=454153 RepID=A0A934SAZ8_9BACT|nr:hypothetical protein [Luteolibacter pohnpeiensis]MBK1884564.1 hypothetical protein [Luteolibacter pohnpeiensis]
MKIILLIIGLVNFASGAMTLRIEGVPGSGVTTWTLSGNSTVYGNSNLEPSTPNFFVGTSVSLQGENQNLINDFVADGVRRQDWAVPFFGLRWSVNGLDSILESDILEQPQITIGDQSVNINQIYHRNRDDFDSIGIRTDGATLFYYTGQEVSWSGSWRWVDFDISEFVSGIYTNEADNGDSTGFYFAQPGDFHLVVIPEPKTAVILVSVTALMLMRRKHSPNNQIAAQ